MGSIGDCLLAGVFQLTIVGVLFSVAGKQRERILQAHSGQALIDTGFVRSDRLLAGLLVCTLTGFLSPLLNAAEGKDLRDSR